MHILFYIVTELKGHLKVKLKTCIYETSSSCAGTLSPAMQLLIYSSGGVAALILISLFGYYCWIKCKFKWFTLPVIILPKIIAVLIF